MAFQLDDTTDIEMEFVEKRLRGTKDFECYLEVNVDPDAGCSCQILYPLGKSWKEVKKIYPSFVNIMEQINGLHEIGRELNEIRILTIKGDDGLYDQNVDEWNSNLREENE